MSIPMRKTSIDVFSKMSDRVQRLFLSPIKKKFSLHLRKLILSDVVRKKPIPLHQGDRLLHFANHDFIVTNREPIANPYRSNHDEHRHHELKPSQILCT